MIKILFDNIVFYLQKAGGVSVVWKELITRLLQNKDIYIKFIEYDYPPHKNLFYNTLSFNHSDIYRLHGRCLFFQRYFPLNLTFIKSPFVFHSSYYRYSLNPLAINITTVHDFTYEYYYKGLKKRVHLWQKYRAISKSDYVICISENTKRDLLKFLPEIDETKIRVIYNGVSDDYFPIKEKNRIKLPFELETYVLFVGSRERYKNFRLAVKAVAQNNLKFVIVGSPLSKKELIFLCQELGQDNFVDMGRVSNEALNYLYNGAMALLYPSEYEGFGIPVLEAQKAGCPVIAYNGSSIPEIIGDTPLLFDVLSVEAITKCLEILKIKTEREIIIVDGLDNCKRFTWDKMYEQVITLYKEAWEKCKK